MTQMIPLLMLGSHAVGDYIAQTQWMADNKFVKYRTAHVSLMGEPGQPIQVPENFWHSMGARSLHVTAYTACFAWLLLLPQLSACAALLLLGSIWITHFITDCRRWASAERWALKPLAVDQSLHIATLAILGVIFGL